MVPNGDGAGVLDGEVVAEPPVHHVCAPVGRGEQTTKQRDKAGRQNYLKSKFELSNPKRLKLYISTPSVLNMKNEGTNILSKE